MSQNNISSKYYTETKQDVINNRRKLKRFTEIRIDRSNKFIRYVEDITQIGEMNNKLNSYVTTLNSYVTTQKNSFLAILLVSIVMYDENKKF
jgi:hypothetical protein